MNVPNIWVPKVKILEPRAELVIPQRMRGYFRLEVLRPDGRRRLDTGFFPNLITDAGLDIMGTLSTWLNACKVGSGNTAPANGNTAMQTFIAATATTIDNQGTAQSTPPYYGARTKIYQFGTGVAAGNVAEVGIGTTASNLGTLWSRALVLDGGGSPTTITVLSDEILNVTYQLRRYPFLSDVTGVVSLNSIDYAYTLRAANVTAAGNWGGDGGLGGGGGPSNVCAAHDGAVGAITTLPAGSTSGGSVTSASYGGGNHYRDFTQAWSISQGNLSGGIDAVSSGLGNGSYQGYIQCGFVPPIPKTSSDTLSLTFRHSWARGSI